MSKESICEGYTLKKTEGEVRCLCACVSLGRIAAYKGGNIYSYKNRRCTLARRVGILFAGGV
jgi:hypothetical protein